MRSTCHRCGSTAVTVIADPVPLRVCETAGCGVAVHVSDLPTRGDRLASILAAVAHNAALGHPVPDEVESLAAQLEAVETALRDGFGEVF